MKCLSLPSTLLLISSVSILTALCLAGTSLAKSVKWNFYNNAVDYGKIWYLYAYQTIWTSNDAWTGNKDQTNMQVFKPIKDGKGEKLRQNVHVNNILKYRIDINISRYLLANIHMKSFNSITQLALLRTIDTIQLTYLGIM